MPIENKHEQSSLFDFSTNAPALPEHVREHLYKVIDYLWDDELNDFKAATEDNPAADHPAGTFPDHIFVHIVSLKGWMEGRCLKPQWFAEGLFLFSSPETKQWPTYEEGINQPDLPDYIREALEKVIEYLWHDELKDLRAVFAESLAAGNRRTSVADHMFVHVLRLKAWMEARYMEPEWYVEDLEPHGSLQTKPKHPPVNQDAPRLPTDIKLVQPRLIQDLLDAAHQVTQFETVKNLAAALDHLSGVLDIFRQAASR
jgi:hypothetical protein